jgi:hypothetical protein
MQLMDELVDAYLTNNLEFQFYLDLQTGQVVLDLDGAAEIDWDDEENHDRYVSVLQIDSDEAYHLRVKFARSTESDPEM